MHLGCCSTFGKQHPACMDPTWNTMHLVFLYAFELICITCLISVFYAIRTLYLIKSIYLYITGKIIEINVHFIKKKIPQLHHFITHNMCLQFTTKYFY